MVSVDPRNDPSTAIETPCEQPLYPEVGEAVRICEVARTKGCQGLTAAFAVGNERRIVEVAAVEVGVRVTSDFVALSRRALEISY